jgi:hypothetical protein
MTNTELPTVSASTTLKRRSPAIFLGIGSIFLVTLCSLFFFSESLLSEAGLNFRELATSTGTCANGLTSLLTGLTQADKAELVQAHNIFRSKVALGKAPGQPGAIDMLEMVWDEQVAERAQSWADQCLFQHDGDANRQPTKFKYVGQNLIYTASSSSKKAANLTQLIEKFYNEVQLYGGASAPVSSYKYDAKVGHYTQLVWAKSYALGCGFKKYYDGFWYTYLLVCNYGPGGNYLNEKMYTTGTFNVKNCKNGASSTYGGLCKA